MKQQQATLRFLRMAPRKVRAVASLIRGLSASEAEAQLMLQPRRAAKPILKLLRSAMANAKNNQQEEATQWLVKTITVDQGPMLKRMLPRARGSASEIQKKMSHVSLTLVQTEKQGRSFTITPKKKKKSESSASERTKSRSTAQKGIPDHDKKSEVEKRATENPGFFRKVFNRKSGMGK
ncbi:MAG: 50S ribosomal protein L22 [Patescibacteria group bacterium]